MIRARLHRLALMTVLMATLLASGAAFADDRIVAIGDIHGNFEGFVSILQRAGLVDDDLRWIGGETTLIQTGDIFDRGVDVRKVLDLLMRLEGEAAAAGGTGRRSRPASAPSIRPPDCSGPLPGRTAPRSRAGAKTR